MTKNDSLLEVVIDGKEIGCYEDFIDAMQQALDFPETLLCNIDGYLDWMRDLSWIDADEIVIRIENAASFAANDPKERARIVNDFMEIIVPFWQDEATRVIVDGAKKRIRLCLD